MGNGETKVSFDRFLWTPHPPTTFRPARGPGGEAENQTGGKQRVSTKTNHPNRQLCRQETLLSLHRIETSWLKLKEINFYLEILSFYD